MKRAIHHAHERSKKPSSTNMLKSTPQKRNENTIYTLHLITNALKKIKYKKSPEMDNICAEHFKNGPIEELSKEISELLNETAKTVLYPK